MKETPNACILDGHVGLLKHARNSRSQRSTGIFNSAASLPRVLRLLRPLVLISIYCKRGDYQLLSCCNVPCRCSFHQSRNDIHHTNTMFCALRTRSSMLMSHIKTDGVQPSIRRRFSRTGQAQLMLLASNDSSREHSAEDGTAFESERATLETGSS